MRIIDMRPINPDTEWRDLAKKTEDDVKAGHIKLSSPAASAVWSALKPQYAGLSHGKCWYCESRQDRSDNAIDHFRPKSKYDFLAFEPKNYRFACTYCNSRRTNPETGETEGKGNLFPLFDETRKAETSADLPKERPKLIDPCVAADVLLLDFRPDGRPYPAESAPPDKIERAKKSIELYHLDHPDLNERRRILAQQIEEWIAGAHEQYEAIQHGDNPAGDNAYRVFLKNIFESINARAELSAFARRMVKLRRDLPWIDRLLDNA